jgi:hypothetical protein
VSNVTQSLESVQKDLVEVKRRALVKMTSSHSVVLTFKNDVQLALLFDDCYPQVSGDGYVLLLS